MRLGGAVSETGVATKNQLIRASFAVQTLATCKTIAFYSVESVNMADTGSEPFRNKTELLAD